jgi:ketosteroid isomerase-like protein
MTVASQAVLTRALEASLTGDAEVIRDVFTEDVTSWSPNLMLTSRAEMEEAFEDRDDALSNVDLVIDTFDTSGPKAFAEWHVSADHTGPFFVGDDLLIEATGRHIMLAGMTVAHFTDSRIDSIRHYFDDAALLEQMLIG